jgi:sulfur carrier protein
VKVLVNGEAHEVPERCTVRSLLQALELPGDGVAVAVDGQVVPRSSHAEVRLVPDARVEVIRAVGGG